MSDLIVPTGAARAELPRLRSTTGRWVVAAAVLGSGAMSFDASVVTIAMPRIGSSFGGDLADLQWVMTGYTLALASLLLVGGALADRFGRRRVFVWGSAGFAAASLLCALAPTLETLVAARALQGIAAALVTPGSLALISTLLDRRDQGAAIGWWAGLGGFAEAAGPIVGGWVVQTAGWRSVFLIDMALAVVVAIVSAKYLPESWDSRVRRPDLSGVAAVVVGLAALTYGLISARMWMTLLGMALLGVFVILQVRGDRPLVPPSLFTGAFPPGAGGTSTADGRVFTAANLVTSTVYAALGGVYFLLPLQLQLVAGYSPLQAGLAMVPITAIMLVSSSWAGHWAQRHGARIPMTVGPLLIAVGSVLLTRIDGHAPYVSEVLPGTIVFGIGLAVFVAPLTTAVFAAVPPTAAGLASGVNNAVARTAQLLAVAALPGVVGISGRPLTDTVAFDTGFRAALWICAALFLLGAAIAAALMPRWRGAAAITPAAAPAAGPVQL